MKHVTTWLVTACSFRPCRSSANLKKQQRATLSTRLGPKTMPRALGVMRVSFSDWATRLRKWHRYLSTPKLPGGSCSTRHLRRRVHSSRKRNPPCMASRKAGCMPEGMRGSGSSLKSSLRRAATAATSPSVSRGASPVWSKLHLSFSTSRALPLTRNRPSWAMP
ncbi:unnamed protein product, partial [Ixodes pacificus]